MELTLAHDDGLSSETSDSLLSAKIRASRVVDGRDSNSWNIVAAMDVLRTPELIARLDASTIRFLRRLLLFFRPSSQQFITLPLPARDSVSVYGRLGCLLFSVLLDTEESRLLSELLRELAEIIEHCDEPAPAGLPPSLLAETLSGEYFLMIRTLMGSAAGMALLYETSIFTRLFSACVKAERLDLIERISANIDLHQSGMPRIIFSAILTSSREELRRSATKQLGRMLRESPDLRSSDILHMLVTQLYDSDLEVRSEAMIVLLELCDDPTSLDRVAALRPAAAHLGEEGLELQLRLLASTSGLEWLRHSLLPAELQRWRKMQNAEYARYMDAAIACALGVHGPPSSRACHARCSMVTAYRGCGSLLGNHRPAVSVQTHLYGVLCSSAAGVEMLRATNHIDEMASILLEWNNCDWHSAEACLNLKAIIWAIAHVCSSAGGLRWLEESHKHIVPTILNILSSAPTLSVRGYALREIPK